MPSPSLSALLREQARLPFLAGNCMALDRARAGWLVAEIEALETDARTLADFADKIIAAADALGGAVVSDDVLAALERRRRREGGRG